MGSSTRVRAITAADAGLYRSILERTSDEDRYCRFFHALDHLAPQHIARFVTPADDMIGFIALDERGQALGAAHAILSNPKEAELAIVVARDARRTGVGRALMTYLIAALQARGCRRIVACALAENRALANLVKAVGMKSRRRSGSVIEWELDARYAPGLARRRARKRAAFVQKSVVLHARAYKSSRVRSQSEPGRSGPGAPIGRAARSESNFR